MVGSTEQAVNYYLSQDSESMNMRNFSSEYDKPEFTLHEISLNAFGKSSEDPLDEYQKIELNTMLTLKDSSKNLHLTLVLNNDAGEPLFTFSHINNDLKLRNGLNKIKCVFPEGFLNIGTYYLSLFIIENGKSALFIEKDIMSFIIQEGERPIGAWMGREPGFIKPRFEWSIDN